MIFASESPRFLISKGRHEEALRVLARYHANGDPDDELVQSVSVQYLARMLEKHLTCASLPYRFEFKEIVAAIQMEKAATAGVGYASFFKTKGNRHRLLILVVSVRKRRSQRSPIFKLRSSLFPRTTVGRFVLSMGWKRLVRAKEKKYGPCQYSPDLFLFSRYYLVLPGPDPQIDWYHRLDSTSRSQWRVADLVSPQSIVMHVEKVCG